MNRFVLFVNLLLFFNFEVFAIDNYPIGARALSLSNTTVAFSDIWSTFHNQAGLASLNKLSVGFFYESKFQIDELSLVAGTLVLPTKSGTFGVSFFQFGKGTFKENKLGLAFSKQLSQKFSIGIQLDYLAQTFPENQRSKGFVTFEGGIIFSPVKELYLGAHIFNPVLGGIETIAGKQIIPAIVRLGGYYQFDEMVLIAIETEKKSDNSVLVKTGIEFLPVKNLVLRFGVSGKPYKYTSGLGYSIGKLITDIGFSYHGNLGITPSVSIQFEL